MKPNSYNYYKILGLLEYASLSDIRNAYMAQKRLLDQNADHHDESSKELQSLAVLQEAYQVLASKQRRTTYDAELRSLRKTLAEGANCGPGMIMPFFDVSFDEQLYHQGLVHLEAGRADQAIPCFKKLLKFEKGNAHLCHLTARAHLAVGAKSFALQMIKDALVEEPKNVEHVLLLGEILERSGRLSIARRTYRAAYQLDPKNAEAQAQYERGSLRIEKIGKGANVVVNSFLPDPDADTLRYKDGLLTWEMVVRFASILGKKFRPMPSAHTFHFTGII